MNPNRSDPVFLPVTVALLPSTYNVTLTIMSSVDCTTAKRQKQSSSLGIDGDTEDVYLHVLGLQLFR